MTIFDFLNDILRHKRGNLITNLDDEQQYQPFLVNRWLSMANPNTAKLVNNTVNRYWPILQAKLDHYRFLIAVIPQSYVGKIAYIKKVKPEKEKDYSAVITALANSLQISQREVIMYVEESGLDLEPLAKALKVTKQ